MKNYVLLLWTETVGILLNRLIISLSSLLLHLF